MSQKDTLNGLLKKNREKGSIPNKEGNFEVYQPEFKLLTLALSNFPITYYEQTTIAKKIKHKLACVNVVASAMINGTLTMRASVFASNVFPVLSVKTIVHVKKTAITDNFH